MNSSERILILALGMIQGIGPAQISDVFSVLKEEDISLEQLYKLSPTVRRRKIKSSSKIHKLLDRFPKTVNSCRTLEENLRKKNIRWISRMEASYPSRLRHFMKDSAPFFLFYKGNIGLLKQEWFLGIIGTRYPARQGKQAAFNTAREIAAENVVIVSGGAQGIDTQAHKGALGSGSSIFILPYGLFYSKRLEKFQNMFNHENHLLLSEFIPSEKGTRQTPILRNRTVASLSDALCIIETGVRGGTLHTMRFAREFGKPILATDFSPGKNPPGNASILATVATSVSCKTSEKNNRIAKIKQALQKGKALLKKSKSRQMKLI